MLKYVDGPIKLVMQLKTFPHLPGFYTQKPAYCASDFTSIVSAISCLPQLFPDFTLIAANFSAANIR